MYPASPQMESAVAAAGRVVVQRQLEVEDLVGDGVDEDDGVAVGLVRGHDAELTGWPVEFECAQRSAALLGVEVPPAAAVATEDLD